MKRIGLLWRTVRHLYRRQLFYQLLNRLRGRARLRLRDVAPTGHWLVVFHADRPVSLIDGAFTFLNQQVRFTEQHTGGQRIDWNYAHRGKLWTYNLNYFDFLNQPGLTTGQGLALIRDFMARTTELRDGLEPYPTSLRLMNWIQFLSRHQIQDDPINDHLFAQATLLCGRLEFHLAGNHLLENGFALLTAGLYFRHSGWFRMAADLVRTELNRQILTDGGHDERSPTYHQTLLDRLLDVRQALQHDAWQPDPALLNFLTEKTSRMLGWLRAITFANGDVPMVNDAAWGVAPTTGQIRQKATLTRLPAPTMPVHRLTDSGYRMVRFARYELFVDIGAVGPDNQPGHAHADTFSFVLYVDNQPLMVDSGTATYQTGPRRVWERSTAAHNTVGVSDQSSSEMWGSFRVGRRARVTLLTDTETVVSAQHDGYRHLGITHERTWETNPAEIHITDRLLGPLSTPIEGIARFYVHPDVSIVLDGNVATIGPVRLTFKSDYGLTITLKPYNLADGFNQFRTGCCLTISFVTYIRTSVNFIV